MVITYYAYTPDSRDEPTAVFRYFEDEKRSPEVYKVGLGWVPSKTLWPRRCTGEITDKDIISEDEAAKIIKSLNKGA